jgi:cytochrome c oxidase assembly factor CtaG
VETPLEVTLFVPALLGGYLLAGRSARPSRARLGTFAAGLALMLAAFATPLERLALHDFLWAHLLQNVVLAEWAPALLVLGLPAALGTGLRVRPLVALPLWLATYFSWHLPWLYDLALRHPGTLLRLEHLTYLAAGCLLWWPVIHGALAAGAKAAYLFAAFVLASPLGLLLALLPTAVYATYRDAAPTWGISALTDQEIAGVTMALEQAAVFFTVFTVFFLRFLSQEQREGILDPLRTSPGR